jgi:hypothetical protein
MTDEYGFRKSVFYRAFMTAVFVGLVATVVSMVYDLIFVQSFGFPLSAIISVSSLIFGVNIVFLVVGVLYFLFVASFKKGDLLFIGLFVLITVFLAWRSEHAHRTDNYVINKQFRNLLAGIVIIMGASAAFLVPYLYHSKKFERNVL